MTFSHTPTDTHLSPVLHSLLSHHQVTHTPAAAATLFSPFCYNGRFPSLHRKPELPLMLTSPIFSKPSTPLVIISLIISSATLHLIAHDLLAVSRPSSCLPQGLGHTASHCPNALPTSLLGLAPSHCLGVCRNIDPSDRSSFF